MTDVRAETTGNELQPSGSATGIVVGIDGSEGSIHALRWALGRSGRFGPVTPMVAWHYPWWAMPTALPGGPPVPAAQEFETVARREAEEALAEVAPDLVPRIAAYQGLPGPGLVELARDAALVVVGTRGRGAVADAVLGSTSAHVVRHATVPVAVVPAHAGLEDSAGRVVVGVDGSVNSIAALAWALRHTPAGSTLEVIQAWTYHLAAYPEVVAMSVQVFEDEARATLDRTLEAARAAAAAADPGAELHPVEARLEYGDPRNVLLDASKGADLLVLGARGHEGVAHLLVGSVTTSLVHKPAVTTVVVPAPAAD